MILQNVCFATVLLVSIAGSFCTGKRWWSYGKSVITLNSAFSGSLKIFFHCMCDFLDAPLKQFENEYILKFHCTEVHVGHRLLELVGPLKRPFLTVRKLSQGTQISCASFQVLEGLCFHRHRLLPLFLKCNSSYIIICIFLFLIHSWSYILNH